MNKYFSYLFLFIIALFFIPGKNVEFFGCPINFRSKIGQAVKFMEKLMNKIISKIPIINLIPKFIKKLKSLAKSLGIKMKEVKSKITQVPKTAGKALKKKLKKIKDKAKGKIKRAAKSFGEKIKKIIKPIAGKIKEILKGMGKKIKSVIKGVTTRIKKILKVMKNAIKNLIIKVKNLGTTVVEKVFENANFLKGPLLKVYKFVKNNKWIFTAISMGIFLYPSFMQLIGKRDEV